MAKQVIFMTLLGLIGARLTGAQIVSDTTAVYWEKGKKTVHVNGCPRLSEDLRKANKLVKMTLKEARARDLRLCSRCPGNTMAAAMDKKDNNKAYPESWVKPPPARNSEGRWIPVKQVYTPPACAPLVSMGADGKLVYRPYSDKGDRIIDFSYCGYKRSEEPLPVVPAVVVLPCPVAKLIPRPGDEKMAYPVGMDSTRTIQAAIDKVAAMKPDEHGIRGAVLLEKGTWHVSQTLRIPAGVVLRGEGDGEDGTIIVVTLARDAGTRQVGLLLGGKQKGAQATAGSQSGVTPVVDSYVPTGATQVRVKDATGFKPGDFIDIVKTTNKKWIELIGCGERLRHIRGGKEGANKRPWRPGKYHHLREVKAVEGNVIRFEIPLPQSIEQEYGGGFVQKIEPPAWTQQCGVENLRIISNYDTTVKGNDKGTNYFNLRSGIELNHCMNAWVRKVSVLHCSFSAVSVIDSRFITVRDSKSLKPVGPIRGGFRYAFYISGSTGVLMTRCYSEEGRHDFVMGARTTGPNVFLKCSVPKGGNAEPHHRWTVGTLWDNITMPNGGACCSFNRGDSGTGHGWAGANSIFWNCNASAIVVFDPETRGENNFAIGYTGKLQKEYNTGTLYYANTRAGYWGTPKEGRYYGYAAMGSGYIESPDRPANPESLFIQQLIERIGKAKALAVLE